MPVSMLKSRVGRFLGGFAVALCLIGFAEPAEAGAKRKPSVLILHTAWYGGDTQSQLAATGLFGAVDLWNAAASGSGTPTVAQLLPYDAVLVAPDYSEVFADNVALGNNLADFVDAGGGVVCTSLAISTFSPPAGRWAPNYQVITPGANPIYLSQQTLDLNSITDSNNLLFVGVGSFKGVSSPHAAQTTVNAGSTILARWTGGHVLAAASNTRARVDLNIFPPSSNVAGAFWDASTDGTKLIANSLLSVIRPRIAIVATAQDWIPYEPMVTALGKSGQFSRIDRINTREVTPTLEQLLAYDAILIFSEATPNNRTALGNVLADYVDAGRGVVAGARGLFFNPLSPSGRWESEFYAMSQSTAFFNGTFAPSFASHPITSGVTSFSTSSADLYSPRSDAFPIATVSGVFGTCTVVLGSTRQPNRINLGWWFGGNLPQGINQLLVNSLLYTIKPYVACYATASGLPQSVRDKLLATKRFSGVAAYTLGVNDDANLFKQHSAIFFWSTTLANESIDNYLGNTFADYVDAGGGIVQGMLGLGTDGSTQYTHPKGRWTAQGYDIIPQNSFGPLMTGQSGLGAVLEPSNPLATFVRKFDGGAISTRQSTTPLLRGRTVLTWADGKMLASVHNFRKCVDLGMEPPANSVVGGNWADRTDGAWLMANALEYAARYAPCPGDFNGDGQVDDADFVFFAGRYDSLIDPRGDLTGDGSTDDADFVRFAISYDRLVCP
ncbi:MAG: hypothetical protein U0573_02855 [Phycisphaerales bacterium]|nr:hypothetical protein [Planctomycetota bacterium]